MTCLLCEDDPVVAMELSGELRRRAVECVVATSSAEALAALERRQFRSAIVDLHLSDGRTGQIVARRLAEKNVRTVILSGGELEAGELADWPHVFIRKPAPVALILDCVAGADDDIIQKAAPALGGSGSIEKSPDQ